MTAAAFAAAGGAWLMRLVAALTGWENAQRDPVRESFWLGVGCGGCGGVDGAACAGSGCESLQTGKISGVQDV